MDLAVQDDNTKPFYYKYKINDKEIELYDIEEQVFGTEELANHLIMDSIEYILRYKYKNGIEDLEKAIVCLEKAIKLLDS